MNLQQQNAKIIWNYLISRNWTQEAVAGILGNMQSESGLIVDRWESDNIGNMNGGYGLVQWTPASKYIDWAKSNRLDYKDIYSQLKRLEWEVSNNQQWNNPNMTFRQYTRDMTSPEHSALLFITYYERPANPNQPNRQKQARYWYNLFKNTLTNGEMRMHCIYKVEGDNTTYYFDGKNIRGLANGYELEILNKISKANNGRNIPDLGYIKKDYRLDANLKALLQRKPIV